MYRLMTCVEINNSVVTIFDKKGHVYDLRGGGEKKTHLLMVFKACSPGSFLSFLRKIYILFPDNEKYDKISYSQCV